MNFLHRTWTEIDTSALLNNFNILKKSVGNKKLMAVVKADAYGHSVQIVASQLDKAGTDCFAVSNLAEALELRSFGIEKPILILGYTPETEAKKLFENDIAQCVYSPEYAAALSAQAVKQGVSIKVHIKLDTGMGRIGFNCRDSSLSEAKAAITAACLDGFVFEGLFTHFAVSDRAKNNDDGFTDEQYIRFTAAVELFKKAGLSPKLCHCCNSAGIMLDSDKHFDISRAGIILYGLKPSGDLEMLENIIPVMTFKTVVTMVKEISAGDTVSYGRTFKAKNKMKVATLSVGYADGYPRLLSNKGYVLINGKKAPIIGRVCMDQLMVDVTDIEDVKMGTEAELFGKNLSVDILAELCGTINYEIVCGITKRVPRITV